MTAVGKIEGLDAELNYGQEELQNIIRHKRNAKTVDEQGVGWLTSSRHRGTTAKNVASEVEVKHKPARVTTDTGPASFQDTQSRYARLQL
jgi:hypothetical protein